MQNAVVIEDESNLTGLTAVFIRDTPQGEHTAEFSPPQGDCIIRVFSVARNYL